MHLVESVTHLVLPSLVQSLQTLEVLQPTRADGIAHAWPCSVTWHVQAELRASEQCLPVAVLLLLCRLQGITWLCREEITTCPSYIHRRLDPLLQLLKDRKL